MKIKLHIRVLTAFLLSLLLSACGEYESLEIKKEAQRYSDSLYRAHRDSLVKEFDLECAQLRDSLYRVFFDSLRDQEAEKIRQLIKK